MNRGQLTLVARLHAEKKSRSEEADALCATQEALSHAHEAIARLVRARDTERQLRAEAELNLRSARHTREAAMRALTKAIETLREVKREAAQREHDCQELTALLQAERSARETAETRMSADLDDPAAAARELAELRNALNEQRRTIARLQIRSLARAAELKELEGALAEVVDLAARERAHLEARLCEERRARSEAEHVMRSSVPQKPQREPTLIHISKALRKARR